MATSKAWNVAHGSNAYTPPGANSIQGTTQGELARSYYVDNYLTVQAAVDATPSGGFLHFTPGVIYTLPAELVMKSGVTYIGHGCTIKAATRIRSYFYVLSTSNVTIEGFNFDQIKTSLAVYTPGDYPNFYCVGIYSELSSNLVIRHNSFINLYTRGIYIHNGSGLLDIHSNSFSSPAQTQTQILEHLAINQFAGTINVTKNGFANTAYTNPAFGISGVSLSGTFGETNILYNTFNYCGRDNTGTHRLAVVDFYADHENVTVEHNVSTNTMAAFMRLSSTNKAKIAHNTIKLNANVEPISVTISVEGIAEYLGVPVVFPGVSDIEIIANKIIGSPTANTIAISLTAYDFAFPSTNIKLKDNRITNSAIAIGVGGPYDSLDISGNKVSGIGANQIKVQYTSSGIVLTALHGTSETNSVYRDLNIENNTITLANAGGTTVLFVSLNKPTYLGTVTDINIDNNYLYSAIAGTGFACLIEANTSQKLECFKVTNNTIHNWATGVYARDMKELIFFGNKARSVTNMFTNGGAIDITYFDDNKYSNAGSLTGFNQIGGGGSTVVANTEVRTGDKIELYVKTLSVTVGNVSITGIINATNFTIQSDNVADSSTYWWKIVHQA